MQNLPSCSWNYFLSKNMATWCFQVAQPWVRIIQGLCRNQAEWNLGKVEEMGLYFFRFFKWQLQFFLFTAWLVPANQPLRNFGPLGWRADGHGCLPQILEPTLGLGLHLCAISVWVVHSDYPNDSIATLFPVCSLHFQLCAKDARDLDRRLVNITAVCGTSRSCAAPWQPNEHLVSVINWWSALIEHLSSIKGPVDIWQYMELSHSFFWSCKLYTRLIAWLQLQPGFEIRWSSPLARKVRID